MATSHFCVVILLTQFGNFNAILRSNNVNNKSTGLASVLQKGLLHSIRLTLILIYFKLSLNITVSRIMHGFSAEKV